MVDYLFICSITQCTFSKTTLFFIKFLSYQKDQKREMNSIEETPSSTASTRKETSTKKRAHDGDHNSSNYTDENFTEESDRKMTRSKYMRDARRKLKRKDFEAVAPTRDLRSRSSSVAGRKGGPSPKKMPTSRKLKREELRKSFSPKRAGSSSTFQPRRSNH